MTRIARHLFAIGLTLALAASAAAQTRTGGQTGQNGGGLSRGGGQMGGGDGVGLVGETVGIAQQQLQTVRNNVVQTSNVLGGYYGNFMYQGQIGSTGASSPGGFGQVMYQSGTTGGMTGAGGMTTGNRAGTTGAAGGRTGTTGTTGFGTTGTTGFGTTGAAGGRTGATGTTGFGGGTTGFGGGTTGMGGLTGGLAGGRAGAAGGQFGAMGGRNAMGGMGQTNPYTVTGDRAVNAYYTPSGVFPSTGLPPLSQTAQTELRGIFDRSLALPDGKQITVSVANNGIAVLKGSVANDDERRIAIGLAAITPGVRRVNSSELKVEPKP